MGTSKAQRDGVIVTCACGCNEKFTAFPVYRRKSEGGGLRVPEYKRGHHPNCRTMQTGTKPAWNKGLTKNDHPAIQRMGFQPGHEAYCDWSHVNEKLRSDPDLRRRWLASKKGQVAWNTGLSRDAYPNGIASGEQHGNWAGGHGGLRDTAEYQRFRLLILKRDHYTCQLCGDHNHKGRGSRITLHVDHIKPVCLAPDRILDPTNARTLCKTCHHATDTYGSKAKRHKRTSGS
jgi:hypothetical protein